MLKGNEHGYAGALYKPGSNENRIQVVDEFKQIRELKTVRDKLYKEIEKLNARNDSLSQNNVTLGKEKLSYQREIKILRSVNEKVAAEKAQLASEYEKCKEQRDKLEVHFSRLSDALVMQSHIDSLKGQIKSLNADLVRAQNHIKDQGEKARECAEENAALKTALDHYVHYDKGGKHSKSGDTLSRESLRDLCFKLAKQDTELHNMSVSLADVFAKLESSREANEGLLQDRDSLKMQLDESLNRFDILENILEQANKENDELKQKNACLEETCSRYLQVNEDLSSRNSEARQARGECADALAAQTAELNVLREEYHTTLSSLQKQLDTAKVVVDHKDKIIEMIKQGQHSEREQLSAEKAVMRDKLQRVDYLEREIEVIRSSSRSAIEERDAAVSRLQDDLRTSRSDLEQYRRELSQSSEKTAGYEKLMQERNDFADALQNAMAASNGVRAKLQHEIRRREMAEAALAAAEERAKENEVNMKFAEQSKTQFSFAMVDAYNKEREKSTILEAELNKMRASASSVDLSKSSGSGPLEEGGGEPLPPTPPASPVRDAERRSFPPPAAPTPTPASPVRQVDPNVAVTHSLVGRIQRIREDLNRAISEEVDPSAQEIDQTIYYNTETERDGENHFHAGEYRGSRAGSNSSI